MFKELLQMDVDRIVDGALSDEKNVPYNSKIQKMVGEIQKIPDVGRWKYQVVILANINAQVTPSQLKKLTGGFPVVVYNHAKVYNDLVLRVIQGNFYNPNELIITLNLSNTTSQSAKISYNVKTAKKECDITLVFVPTIEIARAMYKYRNSILKFNPRSYLELAHNEVNTAIASSILDLTTNEFALFNNGITILSYGTDINEKIGQKDKGQLIISIPQIINGGQTAYTLSRLYEKHILTANEKEKRPEIFDNKEVLLKVITFHPEDLSSQSEYLDLIEAISKATNQQSEVNEADRRSNDQIQIHLQNHIFDKYGWFYERKRGEYADGIKAGYIQRSQIVDRETFLRMCKCCDVDPANAKRMSMEQLFERQHFEETLRDPNRFDEYFFAYQCFLAINQVKKNFSKDPNNRFGLLNYGYGLQFGVYAVVTVCCFEYKGEKSFEKFKVITESVLSKWRKFEAYALKQPKNKDYFRTYTDPETGVEKQEVNFNNYYKGRTLVDDLRTFFKT
ncbi:MAG: AIPR protein [Chloroflexi bacterium]|nr:AIPR protein [Chloroflexota bacterium]WKZ55887.1 MAG: AIPR family protein [Anaerolineales bacterium]